MAEKNFSKIYNIIQESYNSLKDIDDSVQKAENTYLYVKEEMKKLIDADNFDDKNFEDILKQAIKLKKFKEKLIFINENIQNCFESSQLTIEETEETKEGVNSMNNIQNTTTNTESLNVFYITDNLNGIKNPCGYELNDKCFVETTDWQDFYVKICQYFNSLDSEKFKSCDFIIKSNIDDPNLKHVPVELSNDICIESNLRKWRIQEKIKRLLQEYNINIKNLKIYSEYYSKNDRNSKRIDIENYDIDTNNPHYVNEHFSSTLPKGYKLLDFPIEKCFTWMDLYVSFCNKILSLNKDKIDDISELLITRNGVKHLSKNIEDIKSPKAIGNGMYIETVTNTSDKIKHIQKILKYLNIDESEFKIYLQ